MLKQLLPFTSRRLLVALMAPLWLSLACASQREAQESDGAPEATLESEGLAVDTYELSDLALALTSLAGAESWDEVIHIDLPAQGNFAQMFFTRDGVDFYSHGVGVDLNTFRKEAARLSLTPKSESGETLYLSPDSQGEEEDLLFVEIRGDWPEVASQVIELINGIYGTGYEDKVVVSVLE